MFSFNLTPSWQSEMSEELKSSYLIELSDFLKQQHAEGVEVYPPESQIFRAFNEIEFNKVKVVIIGQDPYHGEGQAEGMSFSVPKGVTPPPSLKNIFKELHTDLKIPFASHGNLLSWVKQGVLLLNATLTVEKGKPKSHHGRGWEKFTDAVVSKLAQRDNPVIFALWGRSAQEKCDAVLSQLPNHKCPILKAAHPSPFSSYRGFFSCRHFSKINQLLVEMGCQPINWQLPN